MINLFLPLIAAAQVATWPPPEGAGDKYEVQNFRISYEIFAPHETCTPVETKYFLDVGHVYEYSFHKDINFRPGFKYFIRIDTVSTTGRVSEKSETGVCMTIRGVPEGVDQFQIDDKMSLENNNQIPKGDIYEDFNDSFAFTDADMPNPIRDGWARGRGDGTSGTGDDSRGSDSETDLASGASGDEWRGHRRGGLAGPVGPSSFSDGRGRSYGPEPIERHRVAAGADRTSGRQRESVQPLHGDSGKRGMARQRAVLLPNEGNRNEGRTQSASVIGSIKSSLQGNADNIPKGSERPSSAVNWIAALSIILLVGLGIFGILKLDKR